MGVLGCAIPGAGGEAKHLLAKGMTLEGGMVAVEIVDIQDPVRISVLGGFDVVYDGESVDLPLGAQRLLAYLALRGSSNRCRLAEDLWPDKPVARASANLRSALWRGKSVGSATLIDTTTTRLRLSPAIRIDLADIRAFGSDVNAHRDGQSIDKLSAELGCELLPEWPEDWLVHERERWDQERLHTLEQLAAQLLSEQRYLAALKIAIAAIAIEPVRETAHRAVIEIHAAEGNHASALRHYQSYRELLDRELGVSPSPQMTQLAKRLSVW